MSLFTGKLGSHVQINVHTYIDDETFKLNRFHIHKNNVRTSWYNDSNAAEDSAEGEKLRSIITIQPTIMSRSRVKKMYCHVLS